MQNIVVTPHPQLLTQIIELVTMALNKEYTLLCLENPLLG